MTRDRTEHVPQPTDPPIDEIVGIDGAASPDADTAAHSMLLLEHARIIASERVREGERLSRDAARVRESRPSREAHPSHESGLLKRLARR